MTLAVRASEGAAPYLRLDGYRFSDADPTQDPQSALIRRTEVPMDVADDGQWHRVTVELPPEALEPTPDRDSINAAMFYLGVRPPDRGAAVVGFDDVRSSSGDPRTSCRPVHGTRLMP